MPAGAVGGIGAGVAVEDWQHGFGVNPAMAVSGVRFGAGVTYARPYGLSGLNCIRSVVNFSWGKIATVAGGQLLGLGTYKEWDCGLALGTEPIKGLKVGLGVHGFVQELGDYEVRGVPVFDLGGVWRNGRFAFGFSGQRLNSPQLSGGDKILPRFILGGSWEPVQGLVIAIEGRKQGNVDGGAAGVGFQFFPELILRAGVETAPLLWRGGLRIQLGCCGIDYSYQLHPELGDTHILGISGQWH